MLRRALPFMSYGLALGGHAASAVAQYVVLVALAKTLDPSSVGLFAFALAVNAPLITLASVQLRQLATSDSLYRIGTGDYLSLRLKATLAAAAVMPFLYAFLGLGGSVLAVVVLVAVARLTEQHTDLVYGFLARENRQGDIAKSQLLRAAMLVGCLPLLTRWSMSLVAAAIAYALSYVVVFALYDRRCLVKLPSVHQAELSLARLLRAPVSRGLIAGGLPLTLSAVGANLQFAIPRYFCEARLGLDSLGYFSACFQLPLVAYVFMNALGQCVSPRLAQAHATDIVRFRKLTISLALFCAALSIPGVLLVILYGPVILSRMYTPVYAEHTPLLIVFTLATAVGMVSSVLGYAATAARVFRPQPIIAFVGLALLTTLCFIRPTSLGTLAENVLVTSIVHCVMMIALMIRCSGPLRDTQSEAIGTEPALASPLSALREP